VHVAGAKTFVIPLAIDSVGELVRPECSDKGQEYRCPQCLVVVILRKGKIRRPHFAHAVGTPCSPESVQHKTAKRLVSEAIRAWRAGSPPPEFVRRCPRCHGPHRQPLPGSVCNVAVERPLSTGVVPDLTLLDADDYPIAAIEILATHRVDEGKLPRLSLPWVELIAAHVVEDPLVWVPVQDHLKVFRQCSNCNEHDKKLAARYDEHGYLGKPYSCYKCRAAMTVYIWRGKALWDDEPPPNPIPPTVKYCYSHTVGGKYWVNVCPSCQAIQGDWHLRHPDGGAFFGHEPDEDVRWKQHCDEGGLPKPKGWSPREALAILRAAKMRTPSALASDAPVPPATSGVT
jgi:hypothetical protein